MVELMEHTVRSKSQGHFRELRLKYLGQCFCNLTEKMVGLVLGGEEFRLGQVKKMPRDQRSNTQTLLGRHRHRVWSWFLFCF